MTVAFGVPFGGNRVLAKVVERINQDPEVMALWRASNITAIDSMGFNDHGPTHVRIMAKTALTILRILMERGEEPNVVTNHKMTREDAEVIVVLSSALHDIGHSIHRLRHEELSLILAPPIIRRLLADLYSEPSLSVMVVETMHAMISHHAEFVPLTLEAGVTRVADALDMEKGRARIPFQSGRVNIHSVSALAIDRVKVTKGDERPVRIEITMNNSAGIYQIDELLREKIENSGIRDKITIAIRVPDQEMKIIENLKL